MEQRRELSLTTAYEVRFGWGGWVRFRNPDVHIAYVRFVDLDGRWRPAEVYVLAEEGAALETRALRQIPLGDLEAWANDPENAPTLRSHCVLPGINLRRAAAAFDVNVSTRDVRGKRREPENWVEEMLFDQVEDLGPRRPAPAKPLRPFGATEHTLSLVLTPPPGRDHGDLFYKEVARLYGTLTRLGLAPAPLLAEANGVSRSAVHRWVKEARRRGYLPPARQGKAG